MNIADPEPYVGQTLMLCPEVGFGDGLGRSVNSDDLSCRPNQLGSREGHVPHAAPQIQNTHAGANTGRLQNRPRRGRQ